MYKSIYLLPLLSHPITESPSLLSDSIERDKHGDDGTSDVQVVWEGDSTESRDKH